MEDNKLFKNIWRFNALIIAAVGVLGIIVLLFTLFMIVQEITGNKYRSEVVNIDSATNIEETFRLGSINHVKGSETVIVPLYSDQSFSLGYSGSKSTASTRNLLFSNMASETNSWLLPTNEYLIAEYRLVNESNTWDEEKDVISILYYIVKSDTNKDERLTRNDRLILALSTPEGEQFTEVLEDVDNVLGYDVLDGDIMAVMFNREGKGYTAYINLADFSITKEFALPSVAP